MKLLKKSPFIIWLIIFFACVNAEKKINKGIELYKAGEKAKAVSFIEYGLIRSAGVKKLKEKGLLVGNNVLYYKNADLEIVWPINLKIDIGAKAESENDYNIISYSPDSGYLGISNGYDVRVYDSKGKLIKNYSQPAEVGSALKSMIIMNRKAYIYKNKKIFFFDFLSDNDKDASLLDGELFKQLAEGTYNTWFYGSENLLTAVSGVAGEYYLVVIDTAGKSIIVQDLKIATSKISFTKDRIYYISGSAGKYSLMEMILPAKTNKSIIDFESLQDVELAGLGMFYENKKGMGAFEYNAPAQIILPFRFVLAGRCGEYPVIAYQNRDYAVDMTVFFDKVKYIKEAIPELFNPGQK